MRMENSIRDSTIKYHIRTSVNGWRALEANRRLAQSLQLSMAIYPKTPSELQKRGAVETEFFLPTAVGDQLDGMENARLQGKKRLQKAVLKMLKQSSKTLKTPTEKVLKKLNRDILALETEVELFHRLTNRLSRQFSELEETERAKSCRAPTSGPVVHVQLATYNSSKFEGGIKVKNGGQADSAPTANHPRSLHPHFVYYLLEETRSLLTPIESYTFEGKFGKGGQGQVHRAKLMVTKSGDQSTEVIALKVEPIIIFTYHEVIGEVGFTSSERLCHPNILTSEKCSIFRTLQGGYYMALSFKPMVDGSLQNYTRDHWEERYIACVLKQVLQGLGFMHSKGIIHNDIKPANILIDGGIVMVCDFGKAVDQAKSISNIVSKIGTIRWTAPEMATAQLTNSRSELTPAADIWALGATLYELLEGIWPYFGIDNNIVLDAIATAGLVLSNNENYSAAVRNFFSLMTKMNPEERPSADVLLTDPFIADASTPSELGDWINQKKMEQGKIEDQL